MIPARLLLSASALLGCPQPLTYRPADVQVDLPAALPEAAATVRICVAGAGVQNSGAKLSGRYAMPALPAGRPLDVTIDVLDEDEALLLQGWANSAEGRVEGETVDCLEEYCAICQAEGQLASAGEEAWVLAVRFLD